MLGDRDLDFNQHVARLRRRIWWIVVPTILAPAIAYGGSMLLANRYTSTTLVLVEQQKVPDEFVKPIVTEELNQRLQTMHEQILSRTRLQPIIERFGLFGTDTGKVPTEELVDRLRKMISVTPLKADFAPTSRAAGLPGFSVSFTGYEPHVTQRVCSEITALFMEENLKEREQSAVGTTQFLASQLDSARRNLNEEDAKLATFKARYLGRLPGDEQANLNVLTSLNNQLEATNQAIFRAQQDKSYDESMLAQQLASLKTVTQSSVDSGSLDKTLKALQAKLSILQARYTNDYPDVIKTKEEMAQISKQLDEHETVAAAPTNPDTSAAARTGQQEPLEIRQFRLQIHQLDQQIRTKSKEQEGLQNQIHVYQSRVQVGPQVEQQYKALTRDYQTALAFYDDLLAKKTRSAMATDLEMRQQGEQFRVLDPASLPERPTWPNRGLFALGGLGAGLTIGLGLALLLELRDKTIRTEQDITFYLNLPVLAQVPMILVNGDGKSPRKLSSSRVPKKEKRISA